MSDAFPLVPNRKIRRLILGLDGPLPKAGLSYVNGLNGNDVPDASKRG